MSFCLGSVSLIEICDLVLVDSIRTHSCVLLFRVLGALYIFSLLIVTDLLDKVLFEHK